MNKDNFIRPGKHGSQVTLDPGFLLSHQLYMPDGETVVKSNMTLDRQLKPLRWHMSN